MHRQIVQLAHKKLLWDLRLGDAAYQAQLHKYLNTQEHIDN